MSEHDKLKGPGRGREVMAHGRERGVKKKNKTSEKEISRGTIQVPDNKHKNSLMHICLNQYSEYIVILTLHFYFK